jgi:hypothetical protein
MTTQEVVKLMLKSSDSHPHTGKLSTRDNIEAAIDLSYLCQDFASKGMMDEAMNIPVEQWDDVIDTLQGYLTAYWPIEI